MNYFNNDTDIAPLTQCKHLLQSAHTSLQMFLQQPRIEPAQQLYKRIKGQRFAYAVLYSYTGTPFLRIEW